MTFPGRRRASGGRRGFARARRPGGTWSRGVFEIVTVAASAKALIGIYTPTVAGIGETIRRNVGGINIGSDQLAASEDIIGAFGLTVANDIALAAGAASLPGPVSELDDDGWLVWQGFAQEVTFATAVGFDSVGGRWYNFDSKAMRRVEEGYGLAMMIENKSASIAFQVSTLISTYATRH